jgi:hypothetical protein
MIRRIAPVLWLFAAAILIGASIGLSARAHAEGYNYGCETIRWGFLGSQWRTICDGPKRSDGSWERGRRVWYPAGYVRGSSYCGTYSCSYSEGYYREEGTVALETYVVFDSNVLPDEPGWLPAGTVVIR